MSELTVAWLPHPADEQFDLAAPLLERVVKEAAKGEFTVDDLRRLSKEGKVLIGVAMRDGVAVMAAAMEIVRYPQITTLNVMALCGEGLVEVADKFFEQLKDFARSCGVVRIEASGSAAMTRLLRRKLGFCPLYEKVGFDL